MDVFLAPLSPLSACRFRACRERIFSHHATAWLHQIMNRLAQKYIHSGFTFVIKQPLIIDTMRHYRTFRALGVT